MRWWPGRVQGRPASAAAAASRSLSSQLTHLLIWSIASLWVLMAVGSAGQAHNEINEGMDAALVDTAHRLLDLAMHDLEPVGAAGHHGDVQRPRATLIQNTGTTQDDPLIYQVVDAGGRVLLRSQHAPADALPVPRRPGFSDLPDWRVFTYAHASRPVYLHIADSLAHRREALFETTLWLLLPPLSALPILGLIVHLLTRRGLVSLQHLSQQIGRRGGDDLSPIAHAGWPTELQVIADSTNHLLRRLTAALDGERSLAANAAHELRTPLATVRLRLHTLLGMPLAPAPQHEAQEALASLIQLSRRAEKLLQLSRAESGATFGNSAVALGELAAIVVQEFWARTDALPRIHLQLPPDAEVTAWGDRDALAIVLRNLIENALLHAPGARIDVVVDWPALLRVRDAGPGVAATALDVLRHRHLRQAEGGSGFGLGLSIVQTIVERLGGRLDLCSPAPGGTGGFEAVVTLRPAPTAGADTRPATAGAALLPAGTL